MDIVAPRKCRRVACVRDDGVLYVAGANKITLPRMTDTVSFCDLSEGRFREFASLRIGMPKQGLGDATNCLVWAGPSRLIAALHDGRFAVIDATKPPAPLGDRPNASRPRRGGD